MRELNKATFRKKNWLPENWGDLMKEMKDNGTDAASLDKALQEISRNRDSHCGKTKTGKYLMPEDVMWCRKNSKFKEKELLRLLKRFRAECVKGEMNKAQMAALFKTSFPYSDGEALAEVAFTIVDKDKTEKLDFKDFVVIIDAINAKELEDKIRWAFGLISSNKARGITFKELELILQLLDQVT